jgi:hypothetical protein
VKALLKLDAEIAGTDTLALGLEPAPVEDELLEHAATTRAALAAIDVTTILLAACCNETTSLFRGPDAVSFIRRPRHAGAAATTLQDGL